MKCTRDGKRKPPVWRWPVSPSGDRFYLGEYPHMNINISKENISVCLLFITFLATALSYKFESYLSISFSLGSFVPIICFLLFVVNSLFVVVELYIYIRNMNKIAISSSNRIQTIEVHRKMKMMLRKALYVMPICISFRLYLRAMSGF